MEWNPLGFNHLVWISGKGGLRRDLVWVMEGVFCTSLSGFENVIPLFVLRMNGLQLDIIMGDLSCDSD